MPYSALDLLVYIYSVFSPYKVADYISNSLPAELTYVQLAVVFALAVALLVGKRRTLGLLFLAFGAFEGYTIAVSVSSHIAMNAETAVLLMLGLTVAVAYVVYKLSRLAISAFLALTIGSMYLTVAGAAYTAALVTVAAFIIVYIFYRYISSVIAALLGSILLLLFLIELDIPGSTPYVLSGAAFAVSVLIRYVVSKIGDMKLHESRRAKPHRLRN